MLEKEVESLRGQPPAPLDWQIPARGPISYPSFFTPGQPCPLGFAAELYWRALSLPYSQVFSPFCCCSVHAFLSPYTDVHALAFQLSCPTEVFSLFRVLVSTSEEGTGGSWFETFFIPSHHPLKIFLLFNLFLSNTCHCFSMYSFLSVLGTESKATCILGRDSITELYIPSLISQQLCSYL